MDEPEDKEEYTSTENLYSVYLENEENSCQKNRNISAVEYTECAVVSVILAVFSVLPVIFPESVCKIMCILKEISESGVTDIIKSGINELTGMKKI